MELTSLQLLTHSGYHCDGYENGRLLNHGCHPALVFVVVSLLMCYQPNCSICKQTSFPMMTCKKSIDARITILDS